MNATKLWLTALLLPLAASCATPVAKAPPSEEEIRARWTEFMTPGPGHKALGGMVGKWTGHSRMWSTPDAPPTESTGTSEFTWLLDGRYLQDNTRSEFEGMPFQGIGTTAYDNMKQKYVTTWIDNMGTGVVVSEGDYDAATRTFHYQGEMPDPFQGKYVKSRTVQKMVDADHWTLEIYSTSPEGKEFKSLEIHYTRAK